MKKIVINTSESGYFSLSAAGLQLYYNLTYPGKPISFYAPFKGTLPYDTRILLDQAFLCDYHTFKKLNGEELVTHDGNNCIAISRDDLDLFVFFAPIMSELPWKTSDEISLHPKRDDPNLVKVVEKLGEDASGKMARLEIAWVEGKYRICHDGPREYIETPKDIIWEEA